MAAPIVRYIWNKNNVNTAPLSPELQANGYPNSAIPTSAQFNELFRTVSFLAYQVGSTGEVRATFDSNPIWATFEDWTIWIKYIDGTIGNASSGGTVRANADTVDLFTLLWNNTIDGDCPVSGGRGASAAEDFAANKNIRLPLINGYTLINAANLSEYRLAQSVGAKTHSLTEPENAAHSHSTGYTVTTGSLTTSVWAAGTRTDTSISTGVSGAGQAHNIMQPSTAIYYFIKL
jgi:hypothetical protein